MDYETHVSELVKEGVTILPDVYSQEQCRSYVARFEAIVQRFQQQRRPLDPDCQIIENPFRHDPKVLELLYHDAFDSIFKTLLDEDYVLINTNVINRRCRSDVVVGGINIGNTWHTDSRYLGGKRMESGFGFIACTFFNDCSEKNGGTRYVPRSHLRRERPEREGDYAFKTICASAGSIALFDTGLWHRGGPPSALDRWSLYAYYGPWFVKSYFRYPEMLSQEFGQDFGETLTRPLRRLLHYTSTPPLNEDERRSTVQRE